MDQWFHEKTKILTWHDNEIDEHFRRIRELARNEQSCIRVIVRSSSVKESELITEEITCILINTVEEIRDLTMKDQAAPFMEHACGEVSTCVKWLTHKTHGQK